MKTAWLRYHGKDSLRLSLKSNHRAKFPSMYITVKPIEPESYPEALERVVGQLRSSSGKSFAPAGKKATLYAHLHRMGSTRASAMAKAFELMLKTEVSGDIGCIRSTKGAQRVGCSLIRQTQRRAFHGTDFSVPFDLDGFLQQYPVSSNPIPFQVPDKVLCSVSLSYRQLIASGALSEDYFARKRACAKTEAPYKKTMAAFRENFSDMKSAIRKKQHEYDEERVAAGR